MKPMYNRYIPQPDGSYRRNRMPDPRSAPQRPQPSPPPRSAPQPCPEPPQESPKKADPCGTPPVQSAPKQGSRPRPAPHSARPGSALTFLRQLLPRDFDTGDLLVVLLLLLIAGDCQEDRSTALLTLALYFFM